MNLTKTLDAPTGTAHVRLAGDLDYVSTRKVVDAVSRLLADQPSLRHLRLDCSELTFCDSAGLSGLLQINRQCALAEVALHLDKRPALLDRLLHITGTLEHLTEASEPEGAANAAAADDISGDGEVVGSRGERNA